MNSGYVGMNSGYVVMNSGYVRVNLGYVEINAGYLEMHSNYVHTTGLTLCVHIIDPVYYTICVIYQVYGVHKLVTVYTY